MKKLYFAVTEDIGNGYMRAYVIDCYESDNLVKVLGNKNIISATLCPRHKAYEVVEEWNKGFKAAGKIFDLSEGI